MYEKQVQKFEKTIWETKYNGHKTLQIIFVNSNHKPDEVAFHRSFRYRAFT